MDGSTCLLSQKPSIKFWQALLSFLAIFGHYLILWKASLAVIKWLVFLFLVLFFSAYTIWDNMDISNIHLVRHWYHGLWLQELSQFINSFLDSGCNAPYHIIHHCICGIKFFLSEMACKDSRQKVVLGACCQMWYLQLVHANCVWLGFNRIDFHNLG